MAVVLGQIERLLSARCPVLRISPSFRLHGVEDLLFAEFWPYPRVEVRGRNRRKSWCPTDRAPVAFADAPASGLP